jgi:hypothetical protein
MDSNNIMHGCIHDWGAKKKWVVFKGLQLTNLDLCLFYITIVEMNFCMPIDKMMSC